MRKKIYVLASLFFISDLFVKVIIKSYIALNQSIKIIPNFFYITYVQNKGAAFSILENRQILILLITIFALYFINAYLKKQDFNKLEYVCYSLIIGGILGNLFDRLIYQYVIDYLDFRIFGYHYPVFNLADTYIVIGTIILIMFSFIKEKQERRKDGSNSTKRRLSIR